MNFWENFKRNLTGGDGFQPGDLLRYNSVALPQVILRSLEDSGAPGIGEAAGAVADTVGSGASKAAYAASLPYSYGVSRPLTSLLLAVDQQDPADSLREAWNASEYVSPGQVMVAGFNNYIDDEKQADPQQARNAVNAAIENREKLRGFKDNWWANLVSGSADVSLNFFLDPTVVAGKGAKVARLKTTTQSLSDEVAAIGRQEGGAAEFVRWTTTADAVQINERLARQNPALAGLLGESDDYAMNAKIWLASRGDQASLDALRTEAASVAASLEAQRNIMGFAAVNTSPGMGAALSESMRAELDDLVARDEFLSRALSQERSMVQTTGRYRGQNAQAGISRWEAVERRRAVQAEARGSYRYGGAYEPTTYARNAGVRPVTVWGFRPSRAGQERASGVFSLAGSSVDDAARELQAELRGTVLRDVFTRDEQIQISNRFMSAGSRQEMFRQLDEFERIAATRLAHKYGVTDQKQVNALVDYLRTRKSNVIKQVQDDGAMWVDEFGHAHSAPFLASQSADQFVMLPWRDLDDVFKNLAKRGAADKDSYLRIAENGYEAFQQVWRPAVLFRFGYTIRNVSEGFLRVTAVAGVGSATRSAKSGLNNWRRNRGQGVTGRALRNKSVDEIESAVGDQLDVILARGRELDDELASAVSDAERALILDEARLLDGQRSMLVERLAEGKYRTGVVAESYRGTQIPAVFGGGGGRGTRAAGSSAQSRLNELRGAGQMPSETTKFLPDPVRLSPEQGEKYVAGLVDTANKQFRNDAVMRRLLNGESRESIMSWLRGQSDEALAWKRERGLTSNAELREGVEVAEGVLRRYLPDDELRVLLRDRELTMDDVRDAMARSGIERVSAKQIRAAERLIKSERFAARVGTLERRVDDLNARILNPQEGDDLAAVVAARDAAAADLVDAVARRTRAERIVAKPVDAPGAPVTPGLKDGALHAVDDMRTGPGGWRVGRADADGNTYMVLGDGDDYMRWQPIHGREVADYTLAGPRARAKAFRDRVYNYIGTLPEDTLLRHPFMKERYGEYMRQSIDDLMAQGVTDISQETLDTMARQARRYSERELKRTLYTIDRYSEAATLGRFVSPFFAAFENTGRTWARFMLNDPSVAARANQLLTAPVKAGWVVDGLTGEPIEFGPDTAIPSREWALSIQLPPAVARATGLTDRPGMRISLKSLNVVFQGETPFSPGFGPVVQIPASELIKWDDNDLTRLVADATLTNGPSGETLSWDLLLPAAGRRGVSLARGESAPDFARDYLLMYQQAVTDYQRRGEPVPPNLLELVKGDVQKFYVLRGIANLTLPVAPQFTLKPEYQVYVDKWRQYQDDGELNGLSPAERFRADYPEFFQFATSSSANATGVDPSLAARRNAERFSAALSAALTTSGVDEGIVGAIVNDPNSPTFDEYSLVWQRGRQVTPGVDTVFRGRTDVKTSAERPYVAQGWDNYIAMSAQVDAVLRSRGLRSLSQTGAEDLRQYRRDWLNWASTGNPAWWQAYNDRNQATFAANADAFSKVVTNAEFASVNGSDPSWQAVADYVQNTRPTLLRILRERQLAGGSATLSAGGNEDLAAYMVDYAAWFRGRGPKAQELYDRFFDGEFGRAEDLAAELTLEGVR
jgi:hypothetical protein